MLRLNFLIFLNLFLEAAMFLPQKLCTEIFICKRKCIQLLIGFFDDTRLPFDSSVQTPKQHKRNQQQQAAQRVAYRRAQQPEHWNKNKNVMKKVHTELTKRSKQRSTGARQRADASEHAHASAFFCGNAMLRNQRCQTRDDHCRRLKNTNNQFLWKRTVRSVKEILYSNDQLFFLAYQLRRETNQHRVGLRCKLH